ARNDVLAIDQRLRAAERDKAHSRRARLLRRGMSIFHGRGATRAGRREQAGTLRWRRSKSSAANERTAFGSSSLNIHDFSLYKRRCARPGCRPGMSGGRRGRGKGGPAGKNLRRVFICQGARSGLLGGAPVRARVKKSPPRQFPPVSGKI